MQHVDNSLSLFYYCCHVRAYTAPDLFKTSFSNQLATSVILDLGIRTLHIFHFLKP
jgi:hypothetical protein